MAVETEVTKLSGDIISKITGSILWGGILLVVFGVIMFVMWWFLIYKKKFDIEVKIISERAGEKGRVIFDKAAILRNKKTKETFFRIWGLKIELPQPAFNIIQQSNKGDYIELYRTSEQDIRFLPPPIISKQRIIRENENGKYITSLQEYTPLNLGDEYWRSRRNEENKSMFSPESLLMKLIPYIPVILASILIIFILYVLFDNLPTILSELRELTKEMKDLKQASMIVGAFILFAIKPEFLR